MNTHEPDWPELFALFERIVDAPSGERTRLLDDATRDQPELRSRLERLLALDSSNSDFVADVADWRNRFVDMSADAAMPIRIGAWKIVRELGAGGMGRVFLAERADGEYEQQVALKVIRGEFTTDAAIARFLAERRILARLDHPGIASLVDGGVDEHGRPWFAMQYVDGSTLPDYCAAHKLGLEARLRLVIAVCAAVAYAHRQLVVHCDLKPSNVLVDNSGQPRLLDFGIAYLLEPRSATGTITQSSAAALTPGYAAPEQQSGEPVSVATDVYALGVMLHELLTGNRPHAGNPGPHALARAASANSPVPAHQLRGDLELIVATALRPDPVRRYADANALADELNRYLRNEPLHTHEGSAAYRTRKFLRRHWIPAAALTVVIAALAGAAINATLAEQRTGQALRRADAVRSFLLDLFEQDDPDRTRGKTLAARDLVDLGAQRAQSGLGDDPDTRIELLGVVGDLYSALGENARAAALREHRLTEAEHRYSPDDARVTAARLDLARSDRDREQFDRARQLAQAALDTIPEHDQRRYAQRAEALGVLGSIEKHAGHYDRSSQLQRQRVALLRRLLPASELELAAALSELGNSEYTGGHLDSAEADLREASRFFEAQPDARPSALIDARTHLALLLDERARFDEGEAILRRNLELARQVYGDSHPMVADQLHQLAQTLRQTDRYAQSIPLLQQALAIYERVDGPDHSHVAVVLTSLGQVQIRAGLARDAVTSLERAYRIYLQTLGPQHLYTAVGETALGQARLEAGDAAGAETTLRDALAKYSGANADHIFAESARQSLGESLVAQQRYAEGRPLLGQAYARLVKEFGAADFRSTGAAIALAGCLQSEHQTGQAAALLASVRQALAAAPSTPKHASQLAKLIAAESRLAAAAAAEATDRR